MEHLYFRLKANPLSGGLSSGLQPRRAFFRPTRSVPFGPWSCFSAHRCPLFGSFRPRRTQPSEPLTAHPESAWVNRGSTRPALLQSPPRSGLGAGSENCRVPGGAEEDISPAARFAWPSLEMHPAEDHSPQHALRRDHACPRRGERGTTIPSMHCAGAAPARAEGSAGLQPQACTAPTEQRGTTVPSMQRAAAASPGLHAELCTGTGGGHPVRAAERAARCGRWAAPRFSAFVPRAGGRPCG